MITLPTWFTQLNIESGVPVGVTSRGAGEHPTSSHLGTVTFREVYEVANLSSSDLGTVSFREVCEVAKYFFSKV